MDYKNLTAPCGIPCFECMAFKAGSNEMIKKKISENLGIEYEKSSCEGCRQRGGIGFLSGKNNIFPGGKCSLLGENGECIIYNCAESKQIHNCSECEDFPCENLQPLSDKANLIPHNLKIYNLCLIKKCGIEKWAREKAGKTWKNYLEKKLNQ